MWIKYFFRKLIFQFLKLNPFSNVQNLYTNLNFIFFLKKAVWKGKSSLRGVFSQESIIKMSTKKKKSKKIGSGGAAAANAAVTAESTPQSAQTEHSTPSSQEDDPKWASIITPGDGGQLGAAQCDPG